MLRWVKCCVWPIMLYFGKAIRLDTSSIFEYFFEKSSCLYFNEFLESPPISSPFSYPLSGYRLKRQQILWRTLERTFSGGCDDNAEAVRALLQVYIHFLKDLDTSVKGRPREIILRHIFDIISTHPWDCHELLNENASAKRLQWLRSI